MPKIKLYRLNNSPNIIPITKAAKILEVSPDTLRNWEREGRLVPERTAGGARRYNLNQLEAIKAGIRVKRTPSPTAMLSVSKAAKLLQVSPDTVRNWNNNGILVSQRTKGGARRFSKKTLLKIKEEMGISNTGSQTVIPIPSQTASYSYQRFVVVLLLIIFPIIAYSLFSGFSVSAKLGDRIDNLLGQLNASNYNLESFKKELSNVPKLTSKIKLQTEEQAGSVLGVSAEYGPTIPQSVVIGGNAVVTGILTAPNVVYKLVAGENVRIFGGQTPTISVDLPEMVSSFQGLTGHIKLAAGDDITIDKLTISSAATLNSIRTRGGCEGCLKDSDIEDSITISSVGSISAAAIKSGQVSPVNGGTGLSSYMVGDLIYADSTSGLVKLNIGSPGSFLIVGTNGLPTWTNQVSVEPVSGNVGIGTTDPESTLDLANGDLLIRNGSLCINSTGLPCLDNTPGTIYAYNTEIVAGDLAENYPSKSDLDAGDIVMIVGGGYIDRATLDQSQKILGVISTKPGIVLGGQNGNSNGYYPVALTGRVPIKVSSENGPVKAGDFLTVSSQVGVAAKATGPGFIIGKALADFSCEDDMGGVCLGKTEVFINLLYSGLGQTLGSVTLDDQGKLPTDNKQDKIVISVAASDEKLGLINQQLEAVENQLVDQQQKLASVSAQLAQNRQELVLTPPEILLSEVESPQATNSAQLETLAMPNKYDSAVFTTSLKSLGETFLGSTIVAGDMVVDGTFSIQSGNTVNALPVLFIQKSPLAEMIDFFDGMVTVSKDGRISASEIFAKKIESDSISTTEIYISSDKVVGSAKIDSGLQSVDIDNSLVTKASKIMVTATSGTDQALAVTNKEEGKKFTVSIPKTTEETISFDWLLINQTP